MTEDRILTRIGEHMRAEQKDDARFERVGRGEADADELAELERSAAADPETAVRLEGSRPLASSVADRIAARVTPKARPVKSLPPQEPRLVLGRAAWIRRVGVVIGPVAIAAALLVYVAVRPGPSGPELPLYTALAVGKQEMRGPTDSTRLRLVKKGRDARFEVLLRPETAPQEKVVAYAFTVGPSEATPLEAKVEMSADGAVRITGSARALDGAREIRVVVGPPAAIGRFDDAIERATHGVGDRQVRVLVVPIDRQ